MSQLDSALRIALRSDSPPGVSRYIYPSEPALAKQQRSRAMRGRMRAADMTEIVSGLPTSSVDPLDAQKFRQGPRNRGQLVEQLLTKGSSADRQTV